MNKKFTDIDLIPLRDVSFTEFEKFIDSLTIEKDTWSLDVNITNDRTDNPTADFYNASNALLGMVGEKIVGLVQCIKYSMSHCLATKKRLNIEYEGNTIVEFSFLVHREYQGRGIGTLLIRKIILNPNNSVDMFVARYYLNNIASHMAFKKNGFLVYGFHGKLKDQLFVGKKIAWPFANDHLIYNQPKIIGDKLFYE